MSTSLPHDPYIKAVARAVRNVPHNPRPLCRAFAPQPAPAAFWCVNCGWNEPMHASETERKAIAAVLLRIANEEAAR